MSIKIDIISGFLGAGKTTLIKKLFMSGFSQEKVVLIENEFGEIGIDGSFLKEAGVDIKEINSGCICCSLVGDFQKSMEEVVKTYQPDRIVIEPSGVGKLSDIINAVNKLEFELELNIVTTVVDGKKCKLYMKNFGEFFNNQVEDAKTIVISKVETLPEEKILELYYLLKQRNPSANILIADLNKVEPNLLMEALEGKNRFKEEVEEEFEHHCCCHHHEHGEEHECCHHHEHGEEHECCHHHEHGEEHECCHHHEHGEEHECCHHHEHGEEHECCHHHEHGEEHECSHHHEHGEEHECCHHHEHGEEHECCHHHEHGEEHECSHHHEHGEEHECCNHHEHGEEHECCHHHEHGEEHECCHHHDHEGHHHADEVFVSYGFETVAGYSYEELEQRLVELSNEEKYGLVLRSKGILRCTNSSQWLYFDYVSGDYAISYGSSELIGRFVVIGSNLNKEAIENLLLKK